MVYEPEQIRLSVEPVERLASVDPDLPEGPKKSRTKRSKVACKHCRRRKVRCDVYPHGAPCTNCRLDKIDDCAPCHKKSRRWSPVEGEGDRVKRAKLSQVLPKPRSEEDASIEEQALEAEASPRGLPFAYELFQSVREAQDQSPSFNLSSSHEHPEPLFAASPVLESIAMDTPRAAAPRSPPQLQSAPAFLGCDLSHVASEDIRYLQNKGCFAFPKKDILNELLQSYFDYIAPHMPFVDETGFWDMYRAHYDDANQDSGHTGQTSISLLLFQAMLFAATTCAPMSLLRRLGYTSRRIARRDAFFRVRALYSLDTERDSLVLVQAFLLMSYWKGEDGEDKDAWHWVGLAVNLAHSLGLHRKTSKSSVSGEQLTQRQVTVRRRCWWSCVVRDRLVALSQHRRPRIRLTEANVDMLTLADYNVGLRSGLSGLSPAEELGKRTAMSMFSVQLIRLVLCMASEDGSSPGTPGVASPASSETWARSQRAVYDDGQMIGHAPLDEWRTNLPEVLQRSACADADEAVLPCILVHRNALQIYYHKLILSILTPRILSKRGTTQQSKRNMQMAHASTLTLANLRDDLVDRDSIHLLPSTCFDTASSASFSANEAQTSYVWSSLLAGGASLFDADLKHKLDYDPCRAMQMPTFHDGSGIFNDSAVLIPGQEFLSFLGEAEADTGVLPELATDEPESTAAEERSISKPETVASRDGFLPFGLGLVRSEEGMMDGLVAEGVSTYEKDRGMFCLA